VTTAATSYLALLARTFLGAGELAPPPPADLPWPELKALLLAHRVLLPLGRLVPPASLSEPFARELEALARSLRRRTELLLWELGQVAPALETAGAEPVLLKGPALLAAGHYGPDFPRDFSDLDILVRPERLQESVRTLFDLGYGFLRSGRHPAFYERHHFHRPLVNREGVVVELHWDLTRPMDYVRFDLEELRRDAREVAFEGSAIRVPGPPHLLLHLASQALRGGFSELRAVLDAALLVRAGAADDPRLPVIAGQRGVARALWVLLSLVRDIGGRVVPREFEIACEPPRGIRTCLERLELPAKCLGQFARRRTGFKHLVAWLCAPSARAVAFEVRRFLLPDEDFYLDRGYAPEQCPGRARRLGRLPIRTYQLARLLAYLSWCLLSSRRSRPWPQ